MNRIEKRVNRKVIIESGVDSSFNGWVDELFDGAFDSLWSGILDELSERLFYSKAKDLFDVDGYLDSLLGGIGRINRMCYMIDK